MRTWFQIISSELFEVNMELILFMIKFKLQLESATKKRYRDYVILILYIVNGLNKVIMGLNDIS